MFKRIRQILFSFNIRSQYRSFIQQLDEMKERALELRSTRDLDDLKHKAENVIQRYKNQPNIPEYKLACWVYSECQSTIDVIESGSSHSYKETFLRTLDNSPAHG